MKKKKLLILVLTAVAGCVFLGIAFLMLRDVDYYKRGLEKLEKEDYRGAAADFTRAIRQNPESAQAYLKRGLARARVRSFDDWTDLVPQAPFRNENWLTGLLPSRMSTARQPDYDAAIADFSTALDLAPDCSEAYVSRGYLMMMRKDFRRAETDFNRAIELTPSQASIYVGRSFIWLVRSNSNNAITDLTTAIDLDPLCAQAFLYRGVLKASSTSYKEAIADCNEAIRIKEELGEKADHAYAIRAIVKWMAGIPAMGQNMQGVMADLDKAIEINPRVADYYQTRATFKMGTNYDSAILDCNKAIELDSKHANSYYVRGWARDLKGDNEGAIQDFRKGLEIDPQLMNGHGWWRLADVYSQQKDRKGCLQALKEAIKIDPSFADSAASADDFKWLRDDPEFKRLTGE